jgi:hypothetical protein
MADTSNTQKIVDKTITLANESEQKFTAPFMVATYRIRNNEAATILRIKCDDADNDANSIQIPAATLTDWVPPVEGAKNGHDLAGLRFRSTLAGHSFTVEYIKG